MTITPRQGAINPATVAEWRRRREADVELPPAPDAEPFPSTDAESSLSPAAELPGPRGNGESPPLAASEKPRNGFPADGEKPRNGIPLGIEKPRNGFPADGEKPRNGFGVTASAAAVRARDTASAAFAQSQQAGLAAMIRLAAGYPPSPAPPAVEPGAPQLEPRASPPEPAAGAAPAGLSLAIAAPTPVIDRPVRDRVPANRAHRSRSLRAAWRSYRSTHATGLWLAGILAAQMLLSLRLIWSNTAFMDEALYLWAGHLEIAHLLRGSAIPAFPTYFSGAPVLYPVAGAITDAYGGLAAARLLSLAFMLASTVLLYVATGRLFGRKAGLGAAAIFAVLGPVQVLGAFATFDAMSIFLLALSTWLVIRAQGRLSETLLLAAGLVLALANATKYASVLWDPVIIAVAVLTTAPGGWWRPTLRGARLAVYTFGALAMALFRFGGHAYVQGIAFTTLLRQAGGTPASMLTVFIDSFNWVGIVFLLAAVGIGISFTEGIRVRLLCIALTSAILLAPTEQARIHILTSLHKHVAFGAWFAAIVAGYALARVFEVNKAKGWRVIAAAAGIAAFLGIPQADAMYRIWPNSAAMVGDLAPVIANEHCPCLVTEDNVVNYYLLRETINDKFTGAFSFYYWDASERQVLHGIPAYTQAIMTHHFRVVEVDPDEDPAIYTPITRVLAGAPGWQLVDTVPSGTPRKPFEIWRYAPAGNDHGSRP